MLSTQIGGAPPLPPTLTLTLTLTRPELLEQAKGWMGTVATVGAVRQHGQSASLAVPQLGSCASSARARLVAPGGSGRLRTA